MVLWKSFYAKWKGIDPHIITSENMSSGGLLQRFILPINL